MSTVSNYVDDVRLPQLEVGRSERLLWYLVAVVLIGDIVTTMFGLQLGLSESNPVAKGAIDGYGLIGMLALKMFAIVVGILGRIPLSRKYGLIVPAGLAIPWGMAVVINLYVIYLAL